MGLLSSVGDFFSDVVETAGDFIPGIGDARAQDKANQANIQEAQKNREFQERMSNTAYQRAMTDMKTAGLNPMLAYMQGGASQPSGSQATVQSSSKTGLVDKALQAYTGISAAQTAKQGVNQQADMNDSSIKLNAANAAKSLQEAEKIKINNTKEKKYLPAHKAVGDLSRMAEKTVKEFFTNSAKKTNKMQVSPIYKNNPEYQKLLKKSLPKAGLK